LEKFQKDKKRASTPFNRREGFCAERQVNCHGVNAKANCCLMALAIPRASLACGALIVIGPLNCMTRPPLVLPKPLYEDVCPILPVTLPVVRLTLIKKPAKAGNKKSTMLSVFSSYLTLAVAQLKRSGQCSLQLSSRLALESGLGLRTFSRLL
jgi:hypothetical protein